MKHLFIAIVLLSGLAWTEDKLTVEGKIAIERALSSEEAFAHISFPRGSTGLTLKEGIVRPLPAQLEIILQVHGSACKVGDRVLITKVVFKENFIRFEINGGPTVKQKWYQHITIGGTGGEIPVAPSEKKQESVHGSYVDLVFEKYIPNIDPKKVKELLGMVFDFNAKTSEEAYISTLPLKAKEAILSHTILVGMNSEMVLHALGKPNSKCREKSDDSEDFYEEWLYGRPPATVTLVRFCCGADLIPDVVTRIETIPAGGSPIIQTEREIELPSEKKEVITTSKPPTLKRPGDQ